MYVSIIRQVIRIEMQRIPREIGKQLILLLFFFFSPLANLLVRHESIKVEKCHPTRIITFY